MRLLIGVILFCALLNLFSCNSSDIYAHRSKTVDSLSGAVSAMIATLKSTDTAVLSRSVVRFRRYKQFIGQNVTDTLSKTEADHLQHFMTAGERLQAFSTNRYLLLNNAVILNSQLDKLSHDIKNKSIDLAATEEYCRNESQSASRLLNAGLSQNNLFHTSLQEFRNALPGVEQIIRSRNNGELPTIIKDTVDL